MFELDEHGIVVTGAGGHLGRAMTMGLARMGATVFACGRRPEPLEKLSMEVERAAVRGRVVTVTTDCSTDEGVRLVLDRTEKEAGRCYGWVHNAFAGSTGRLLDATRSSVESTVSGLSALILGTQQIARRMTATGGGAIVNIASMYGVVSPQPAAYAKHPAFHNPPAYGAVKAGVIQFTRYAACELAPHGIRVNCVSPGPFPSGKALADDAFVQELARRVPLGRVGEAHEIAGVVVFLLSDASSYVTGQNFIVDGGWTAW